VVEVVRDTAGELARDLEALILLELRVEVVAFDPGVGAFGVHPDLEPLLRVLGVIALAGVLGPHPDLSCQQTWQRSTG
jgi:hypothetical protein